MSLSRIERSEKNIKKRLVKSPAASSSAAETVLLLTKQFEKTDFDFTTNPHTTHRGDSGFIHRNLKRTQSSEYIKILTEKNQEIKKLQEENSALNTQIKELSGTAKKYYKVRAMLKEKELMIEGLKQKCDKPKIECRSRKGSGKKKKTLRIHSRVSLDSEYVSEYLTMRPSSAVNFEDKQSPKEDRMGMGMEMKSLLKKTEKILKGWKKNYKLKK